jgi:hypothetical protein
MQLSPIITRIKLQLPTLRQVTAASSVPMAVNALKTFPSACILQPRGGAGPNLLINAIDQQVTDSFSVILAVHNVKDMFGLAAAEDIDALRPTLITALLNWSPATGYDPVEYSGHQLVHFQDGIMLYADHFVTRHHVRAV